MKRILKEPEPKFNIDSVPDTEPKPKFNTNFVFNIEPEIK